MELNNGLRLKVAKLSYQNTRILKYIYIQEKYFLHRVESS